jgi:hypothetical protein
MLAVRGLVDDLVLEDPGEVVWDEDGVEACRECGVDVGAGAVADHPGVAGLAAVVGDEGAVGVVMFFREDFDGGEVRGEAGALQFAGLLFRVSFGDHDEAVAGGEVGQGWSYVGEKLDLVVGDGLGEAFDAAVFLGSEGDVGELLETGDEGAAEAVEAVAVGEDGVVLDAVEVAANLFGSVDTVIEVGDEAGDGSLEVDVVLPEGVVGVDEQGLVGRAAHCMVWRGHRLIIRSILAIAIILGELSAVGMPRLGDMCHGRGV